MRKISFVLRDPYSKKPTPIEVLHTCSDGRLKYYTKEHADPKTWPKLNRGSQAVLNRVQSAIETLSTDYKFKGEPLSKAILKAHLDNLLNKKTTNRQPLNYFEQLEEISRKMKDGRILTKKNKTRYKPSFTKTVDLLINTLRRFDPSLSDDNITIDTYQRFIVWCHQENFSTNYIGTLIKNWKILGQHLGGNKIYDHPDFKKISEQTDDIYLDKKEIEAIINVAVPDTCQLARDWFVIGWCTGLRVSDLVRLKAVNLSGKMITISNEKTGEKVIIPVHPYVENILKRYKGFPPQITDVELNREIKKVARLAKINNRVLYSVTKGGKREDHYMEKWEMVSSHTARRSFITNNRKSGTYDSVIMNLAGIKSPATLKRYDKLSADEAAKIAAGMEFFK
jgi:integrase